jgi:hypothetical protein
MNLLEKYEILYFKLNTDFKTTVFFSHWEDHEGLSLVLDSTLLQIIRTF